MPLPLPLPPAKDDDATVAGPAPACSRAPAAAAAVWPLLEWARTTWLLGAEMEMSWSTSSPTLRRGVERPGGGGSGGV